MAVVISPNGETDVVLRDGSILHIRPTCPADEASIRAFLDRLSPRSLHLRFGTAAPNLEAAAHQPVVLTSPGLQLSWEETTGRHAVTALLGQPTGARLHEAIQAALATAPAAGT